MKRLAVATFLLATLGLLPTASAAERAVPTLRLEVPFTVSHGSRSPEENCHSGFSFSGEGGGGDVIGAFLGESCAKGYDFANQLGGWAWDRKLDSCLGGREVRLVQIGSGTYASVHTDPRGAAFFFPDYSVSPAAVAIETGDYDLRTDRLQITAHLQKVAEVKKEGRKAPRHQVRVICSAFKVHLGTWIFKCWSPATDSYYTSETICPDLVESIYRKWPLGR